MHVMSRNIYICTVRNLKCVAGYWCNLITKSDIHRTILYRLYHSYLYMVSASTSPNQTFKFAVKCSPVNSNMATSPPPFS